MALGKLLMFIDKFLSHHLQKDVTLNNFVTQTMMVAALIQPDFPVSELRVVVH